MYTCGICIRFRNHHAAGGVLAGLSVLEIDGASISAGLVSCGGHPDFEISSAQEVMTRCEEERHAYV
jgi:hypothetical protein